MKEASDIEIQNADYYDMRWLDRIMQSGISDLEGVFRDSLEQCPTFRQVSLYLFHRWGKEAQKSCIICLRLIANRCQRRLQKYFSCIVPSLKLGWKSLELHYEFKIHFGSKKNIFPVRHPRKQLQRGAQVVLLGRTSCCQDVEKLFSLIGG